MLSFLQLFELWLPTNHTNRRRLLSSESDFAILRFMSWTEYEDYKPDQPLIKDEVAASQGIVGCEMHDLNGWGLDYHVYKKPPQGHLRRMINLIFGITNET